VPFKGLISEEPEFIVENSPPTNPLKKSENLEFIANTLPCLEQTRSCQATVIVGINRLRKEVNETNFLS
jgi:hypothetical protein